MHASDLQAASFRGVQFAVRAIGGTEGRRTKIHQFPGREDAVADDLGRSAPTYRYEAVVTGEDWAERYQMLLLAYRTRGPGELVTPEGYRVNVVASSDADYSVSSVGEVVLSLSFTEVADAPMPTWEVDQYTAIQSANASLLEATKAAFVAAWRALGQRTQVIAAAVERVADSTARTAELIRTIGSPTSELREVLTALQRLQGSSSALARAPEDLTDAWLAVFSPLTSIETTTALAASFAAAAAASTATSAAIAATGAPDELAAAENARAYDLTLLVMAVSAHAAVVTEQTWEAYDDAKAAVAAVTNETTTAELLVPIRDAPIVSGLADLRAALVSSVLVVAQQLPRLTTYTPVTTTSAAEIAQRLYQDGSRADEIVRRNGIQHPGFVSDTQIVLTPEG